MESQRSQQTEKKEINTCPLVSAPSDSPWSSLCLGIQHFLAIQRALRFVPGMQPLHFLGVCLAAQGWLIRAVTRLGRSISASPPFSWSCFLLSSHPRPPPKISYSCSAIIAVCLPRKSITQHSWISRMGRGEGRISGQGYSSVHQLSDPWRHLPIHSMLQTSQKN